MHLLLNALIKVLLIFFLLPFFIGEVSDDFQTHYSDLWLIMERELVCAKKEKRKRNECLNWAGCCPAVKERPQSTEGPQLFTRQLSGRAQAADKKNKTPAFREVLRYFSTNRAVASVPTVRVVEDSHQQIQHSVHTETDVWMIGKAVIANWSVLLSMVPTTAGVKWELTWDPQQSLQKQGTQPIIYPNNPSSSSVSCKPLPLHRRHCFSHNIPPLRRLSLPNTQAAIFAALAESAPRWGVNMWRIFQYLMS